MPACSSSAKIGVSAVGIAGNAVQVRVAKAEDSEAALKALKLMVEPLGNPLLGSSGQNVDVTKGEGTSITITPSEAGLRQRVIDALSAAIETVRRRVDAMEVIARDRPAGFLEEQDEREGEQHLVEVLGGDELKRATWEAAEENLAYAEEHAPGVADHHFQLALLYRDTGRPELALQEISHMREFQARNALEAAVHAEAEEVWSDLSQ